MAMKCYEYEFHLNFLRYFNIPTPISMKKIPSGYLTVRHGIDGPFIDGLPIK